MSEIEKIPTWRDNKIVLRLVRIGFLLQFYIPALIWVVVFAALCIEEMSQLYRTPAMLTMTLIVATIVLYVFAAQWIFFAPILRFMKLRSAAPVLWCLIVTNILHIVFNIYWVRIIINIFPSMMNILLLKPPLEWLLILLVPPTVLYIIAILVE